MLTQQLQRCQSRWFKCVGQAFQPDVL
jgi:hypothetical protein